MSGLLNTTGAVSGILGTTVGTPAATTAATLGAGVLPVGVTGGSGLTALGTVVSGNISHADIVYPAGHVVYMEYKKCAASAGITIDGSWYNSSTVFISVPAAVCNVLSSIFVNISYQVLVYQGASHHFCNTRIGRTAPSAVDDLGVHLNHGHNGTSVGSLHPIYEGASNCVEDSSLSNAIHTYYLQAFGDSGYTSEVNPAQTGANITVWGIK